MKFKTQFIHSFVTSVFLFVLLPKAFCTVDNSDGQDHVNLPDPEIGNTDKPFLPPAKPIPYAMSPTHLIQLSYKEEQLYHLLANYEQELLDRLLALQRYKADYEDSSALVLNQMHPHEDTWTKHSHIASNSILSHRMIRRFKGDVEYFRQHIKKDLETSLNNEIENLKGLETNWPQQTDFIDSFNSLIRLTEMHDLDVVEFSEGRKSRDVYASNLGMTAAQCYEMAELALSGDNTVSASDWAQAAYYKIVNKNDATTTTLAVSDLWKKIVEYHAKMWEIPHEKITEGIFTDAKAYIKDYYDSFKGNSTFDGVFPNYLHLCRGEQLQSEEEKSKLYCWLEKKKHPYWKINPLKIELLSRSPYLIQIHDFVRSRVMEAITVAFIPIMAFPDKSFVASNEDKMVSEVRTSVTGWLNRDDEAKNTELQTLYKKIEFATGLHVLKNSSAEQLQLVNYAYGNYYAPHLDTLSSGNYTVSEGERIASFIIYLEETFAGAETVFPTIGVSVKPIKGSAIFWYNLHRNGTTDLRTYHGGCPLREGFKMIATKWIYDQENFLKRPCSRNQYL